MSNQIFIPPEGEHKSHTYQTDAEQKLKTLLSPFEDFIGSQTTASFVLIGAIFAALFCKNASLTRSFYEYLVSLPLGIHIDGVNIVHTLKYWTNELLLSFFFYFVGLEIKREMISGELQNPRYLSVILSGALGGMLLPGAIFYGITYYYVPSLKHAWAIPMATDTAIALGVMLLLKRKLVSSSYAFIAALAIFDDIAAIILIAVLYSGALNMIALLYCLGFLITLAVLNYLGFRKPWPYLILGFGCWLELHHAGLHGAIAGVLVAARPERGPNQIMKKVKRLLHRMQYRKQYHNHIMEDEEQEKILHTAEHVISQGIPPLSRWESALELPVALVVLPLFAFLNSGINISLSHINTALSSPFFYAVALGLLVGKPLGITIMVYIAETLKVGQLPEELGYKEILILGLLCGIGFTMSVFISSLALHSETVLEVAKMAIIVGSFLAGLLSVVGAFLLL